MASWCRRDEEKLLEAINGGNSLYFASSVALCGRFDVTACQRKLTEMETKVWNVEDENKVWKLQSLFETHASQVSMQLRRPISSIQSHLREMKSHRFKPLNRVIENYKYETVMSSNEKQKYDHAFKRFMSFEDEEYNKFYKKVFTDFVDLIAYKDFKTEGEIEFRTILFIPGMDVSMSKVNNIQCYVKRVFAFDFELVPRYFSFMRAVVDSDVPFGDSCENLQESSKICRIVKKVKEKTFDLIQEISQSEDKEGYKNFWDNYGRFIKMGCIEEDMDNQKLIMPLLRFYSSKSEELTSLDEYIDHMGASQKGIYYLAVQSLKSANSAHFLEKVPQTTEVLFLLESIDETLIRILQTYRGKVFVNIKEV